MKVQINFGTCAGQHFGRPLKSTVNCLVVAAKGSAEDIAVHETSTAVPCAVPLRRMVFIAMIIPRCYIGLNDVLGALDAVSC